MNRMFFEAQDFAQNLESWNVLQVTEMSDIFYNTKMYTLDNYKGRIDSNINSDSITRDTWSNIWPQPEPEPAPPRESAAPCRWGTG